MHNPSTVTSDNSMTPVKQHHRAKLTPEQVTEMRKLREANKWRWTYLALATKFGCGESTARDITNYYTRLSA